MRQIVISLAFLLAACSDAARPPPQASGEWQPVNPARLVAGAVR